MAARLGKVDRVRATLVAEVGDAAYRAEGERRGQLAEQGRLVVEKAGLASLEVAEGKLIATLQRSDGAEEKRAFDAVALCTGPGKALEKDPLVAQLVREGLARPDATATGLAVDEQSRLIDRQGVAQADLFAFGPLTRGSFGEMTGAPDITRQIERVAQTVAA